MPTYNFKRELKLYVVYGGLKYLLDIYPDITFSQTFNETPVQVKTLHTQTNMFDKAVITKANPANFSFTIPLLTEDDMNVVSSLLIDYDPASKETTLKMCDLYVESSTDVYKLEKAVFESGSFQIVKDRFISLSISGTASKLSRVVSVPGTLQVRSGTSTYVAPNALEVTIDSVVQAYIANVNIELSNDVQWVDYETLHKSLDVVSADTSMYPSAFVVSKRTLSGNVQQYVTETNNTVTNTWKNNTPLRIRAGASSSSWLIDFNMPAVVYTNRLEPNEIFTHTFDFRMTSSPVNLTSIITI